MGTIGRKCPLAIVYHWNLLLAIHAQVAQTSPDLCANGSFIGTYVKGPAGIAAEAHAAIESRLIGRSDHHCLGRKSCPRRSKASSPTGQVGSLRQR